MVKKRINAVLIWSAISISLLSSCSEENFLHRTKSYEESKTRANAFISQSGGMEALSEYMGMKRITIINKTMEGRYEAYAISKGKDSEWYVRDSIDVPKDLPIPQILSKENGWTIYHDGSPSSNSKDYMLEIRSGSDGKDKLGNEYGIYYLQIYRHEKSRTFIQYENIGGYTSEFQIGDNWTIGYPCTRETCKE